MIDGGETDGGFSLVEHPMPPRALAAPLHRHTREDEYSFVLEGRMGALLGDEVVGRPRRPRSSSRATSGTRSGTPATSPRRILEIISPAGFEQFFDELVDLGGARRAAPEVLGELCARYGLEMQPDSVPGLVERFGLRFPGEPL